MLDGMHFELVAFRFELPGMRFELLGLENCSVECVSNFLQCVSNSMERISKKMECFERKNVGFWVVLGFNSGFLEWESCLMDSKTYFIVNSFLIFHRLVIATFLGRNNKTMLSILNKIESRPVKSGFLQKTHPSKKTHISLFSYEL
jgi:hypothetical protein